jgi:hypothetical protein
MEKIKIEKSLKDLIQEREECFKVNSLKLVNTSQWVLSKEDIQIVVFLKGGLKWPLENLDPTKQGLVAIKKFIAKYPPKIPKKKDVQHKKMHVLGTGIHHLAFWHAIGQQGTKKPKMS